jgi:hypothetical protein
VSLIQDARSRAGSRWVLKQESNRATEMIESAVTPLSWRHQKLTRVSTLLMLLGSWSFATACGGDEETCDPVSVYRLDPERQCYGEPEEEPELRACRRDLEKGIALECVRSPEGELYAARRNGAAWLESASWTFEEQLSATEKAACDQVRSAGFPSDRRQCPN